MLSNIEEIKQYRKKLGLTQKELSKLSGVSQSAIAKIESGLMDPGFSVAQKIFRALQTIRESKTLKAKNVMSAPVTMIDLNSEIEEVVTMMKKRNFSQFPVTSNGQVVGVISESNLLDAVMKKNAKIKDVMGDVPPMIVGDTPLQAVIELLHYFPLVLVQERGKITGIITKTDVLTKNF